MSSLLLLRRRGPAVLFALVLFSQYWANAAQPTAEKSPPIQLEVDATQAPRTIYHAKLTIPVEPGPMTLFFPKWIPGYHGPVGPLTNLAGLKFSAGGESIPWRRDDVDMFAFHCTIPEGAKTLNVSLDSMASQRGEVGSSTTPHIAVVRWNEMLLYPKGKPQQEIFVQATLRVPDGWKFGSALPVENRDGSGTRFAPVSLETLVDSPLLCGQFFREVPITPADEKTPHFLELACDSPEGLEIPADVRTQHERLVAEAGALFGARHYRSYRFLVTLSKGLGSGLEHHESSDNGGPEPMMVDKSVRNPMAFLLPHEFTHSWNGKYRRPAEMITADFQAAQKTRLLWVYEGLTEYIGTILTARCGLWTPEETRDYIAFTAEKMRSHRGRKWRPLEDTAVAAPRYSFGGNGWMAWKRALDYYYEGLLIWLEVDTKIRELTHGSRSLDDFCRHFHGGESGPPMVKPYGFSDIVEGLNSVAPNDWKTYFTRRLTLTADDAPLEGIEQAGWRLSYDEKASSLYQQAENADKMVNHSASIGLILSPEGSIIDVIPDKPGDRAGLAPGMKVVAVNSRRYSTKQLAAAITAGKAPNSRLELLVEDGDFFKPYSLEYHDGLKYPRLVREESKPDLLDQILKPLTR
jgi:predicted metalloprotease with PDZ domain